MSQELFFTSAPKGLKPGSRGFCTVAATAGMPAPLAERLESLSGYRPLFPAGDPSAAKNPVVFAHWRLSVGGSAGSVLSRVCFAGFDYTGRSNKLAHHLFLQAAEEARGGPAWVMLHPGVMESQWVGEPRVIPAGRQIPQGDSPARACNAWAAVTGDAGWAGVLAESFILDSARPAYLIFSPGTELLPLIDEALALVPPNMRWQVTFSTYFTDLPAGLQCAWRCVAAGSPAAKEALRSTHAVLINLTDRQQSPNDSKYVRAARGDQTIAAVERDNDHQNAMAASAVAIQDPSTSPSRRLSRRQRGPADRGSADWMPPVGATIVEGPDEDERSSPRPSFWIIAILWPIVVAAIVFAALARTRPTGSALPTAAAGSSQRIKELEDQLFEAKERYRQRENFVDPAAHQKLMNDAREEAKKAAKEEHVRELEAAKHALNDAIARAQTPSSQPAAAVSSAATNGPTTTSAPPDATADIDVAEYPKNGSVASAGAKSVVYRMADIESVELLLPNNTTRQDELEITKENEHCIIRRRWKPPGDPSGGEKTAVLARLERSTEGLQWMWDNSYTNDTSGKRANWDALLRLASIRVNKGGTTKRIQFHPIPEERWELATPLCPSSGIQVTPSIAKSVTLELPNKVDPWTIELGRPDEIVFKSVDVSHVIQVEPPGLSLTSTWLQRLSESRDVKNAAAAEADGRNAEIQSVKKQLADSKGNQDQDLVKKARDLENQQITTRQKQRVYAERYALLMQLPRFQLLVKIPNGVVLRRLFVSVRDPEAKDNG